MTDSSTSARVHPAPTSFDDEVLASARSQAARAEALGCHAEALRIRRFVGRRTADVEGTAA